MRCAGDVCGGGGFSVMWIAPFDSVVISLKDVIELSRGGVPCDSAGWLWKVRLRSSSTLYCVMKGRKM